MANKHTPGPWVRVGPAALEWGLEPTRPQETDFHFQEVHGSDGDLVALAAGVANATLIAAAPKMLEELKYIEQGWAARERGGPGFSPLNPWETERLSFVRAAINRSEGGEHDS